MIKIMSNEMVGLHFSLFTFLTTLAVNLLQVRLNLIPSWPDTITNSGIPNSAKNTAKTRPPGPEGAMLP